MQPNRLAAETSPYLRQHAANPVDWHPWGPEALALAARDDKPILLSVGYSACHWCHVMAHESFEDPAIAALMNELFVNIKVDREERPDLDKIYQVAQQLITRHNGGWPLTMFLTPGDQRPFFGGTYFPKEARHGMPGFAALLRRVADYFRDHRSEIRRQNDALALAFEQLSPHADPHMMLDDAPLRAARAALEAAFDPRYGGFGRAPKFPQAAAVERSLRHWHSTSLDAVPDLKALYIATLTLTRMAEGGIYDQLGGGFARYSVDDFWMIPHFEKMLYDNGQLLFLYASAYQATGDPLFAKVAGETADWILRDLGSPEGAFHSSLDADSEGQEGRFYAWDRAEIEALLTPPQFAAFARRFGLGAEPNFEGRWHLHACEPVDDAAAGAESESPAALLAAARSTLLAARERRVRPARDDKILTAWNALAIKGLALAGRVLDRPDLIEAAGNAVDFIYRSLWRDGRLLATAHGARCLPAYLDDYAFLADALLELLQARWRTRDLQFACNLLDVLLAVFEDGGGFHFTAADHEPLIHRSKTFADDSLPSGNGVAASALCRMGFLLGDRRYLTAAERTLKAAGTSPLEEPLAHMTLLNALGEFLVPTQILVIRGEAAQDWARALRPLYAPSRLVFAIPEEAADLPPALAEKRSHATTTGYLCTGMSCSAPVTDLSELSRRLARQEPP